MHQDVIFRKQRTTFPRAEPATGEFTSRRWNPPPPPSTKSSFCAETELHRHRRCVYNFCRRPQHVLLALNASLSKRERKLPSVMSGMPKLNEEGAAVQYDIKQNSRVFLPRIAVRLYPVLKCPTCKPPRDATQRKRAGVAAACKNHKGDRRQTLAKTTDDRHKESGYQRKFVREKSRKRLEDRWFDETPSHAWYMMLYITFVHIASSRVGRRKAVRSNLGAVKEGEEDWPGPALPRALTEDCTTIRHFALT